MKYQVNIKKISSVNEIQGIWSVEDYLALLDRFGLSNADKAPEAEMRELLFMAISDFEADEAAAILLEYKLADQLSEGQIKQLSHEMMEDKVAEEYPDMAFHAQLFHINQLLFKAYNGTFPNTKASIIEFSMQPKGNEHSPLTKEMVLKAFASGLSDRNVISRLFADQLNGEVEFPEAESIIWQLTSTGANDYKLITSDYWINDEDFTAMAFEGKVVEVEEHSDK